MKKRVLALNPVLAALLVSACSTNPVMPENAWKIAPVQSVHHGATNDAAGYFALGRYKERRGANEEAIAAYREALDADPEHAAAWNALGSLQAALGRFEDGLRALERAVSLAPAASHLYNNLGYALLLAGRHDAAATSLRRAVELDGNNRRAWTNLATVYRRLGMQDKAEFANARASGASPAAPAPILNVAQSVPPAEAGPAQPFPALSAAPLPSTAAGPSVTVGTIAADLPGTATPIPALAQAAAPAPAPAAAIAGPAVRTTPRARLVKVAENVFELLNGPPRRETAVVEAAAIITAAARPSALPRATEPLAARAATPNLTDDLRPAAAPRPSASRPARHEISNGHGGEGLARRLAGLLEQQGAARPRLTNSRPFDQAASFVEYRDGYREAATAFAARLPFRPAVRATASNDLAVDVRLMLGHDLTKSDACAVLGLCPQLARSAGQVAAVQTAAAFGE
ncbi:LytR C-terminal domain-containing protein [Aromatoleum buckelii]|uniref:Tetratricopeptide repeat protein n=1 Tax=Aromatoleum buckelii TaxID=200254 RepID=A0ABX1MV89_9RHOO|nr:LytR C-terminal domain-containing protein [Aromatoleum buckelii]MCK0510433.1 LytR C-terminal domain-containing protein [Aromatoleum buckelii]